MQETRYAVKDMTNNVEFLQIATRICKEATLTLQHTGCGLGDDSFPVPDFRPLQFPILACFETTKNKTNKKRDNRLKEASEMIFVKTLFILVNCAWGIKSNASTNHFGT